MEKAINNKRLFELIIKWEESLFPFNEAEELINALIEERQLGYELAESVACYCDFEIYDGPEDEHPITAAQAGFWRWRVKNSNS